MTKTNRVQLQDFARAVLHGQRLEERYLDVGYDQALPFRAAPSPGSKSLVVVFHGAVNREKRSFPAFGPYMRGIDNHAHQIAFADPTLALSDRLTISWFAGSASMPLQSVLVSAIERLRAELEITRLIFVGGSGGGFAALYYSWHFPGSVAVAYSPQTVLSNYGQTLRDRYSDVAWPEGVEPVGVAPTLDLRDLYGRSIDNLVLYLQSYDDRSHLFDQMLPFLDSIPRPSRDRILTYISYWGKPGHSGSVPVSEVARWVRIVLALETPCVEDIRDKYYEMYLSGDIFSSKKPVERVLGRAKKPGIPQDLSVERQRLADRLARETLQTPTPRKA